MQFRIQLLFVVLLILFILAEAGPKRPGQKGGKKGQKGAKNKCPEGTITLKGNCKTENDCKKDGTASIIFCYGTNPKVQGVCCKAELEGL